MKVRQDAWSHEDDLLLAETVLRYIREGGTQLAAFEEVGDKLNRTSAACGFRWNAEVRRNYEQAISIAKKQRKERKRAIERANKEFVQPTMTTELPFTSPLLIDNEDNAPNVQFEEYSAELLPVQISTVTESVSLDDCISFLMSMKHKDVHQTRLRRENETLRHETDELRRKNKELEKRLEKLSEQQTIIQEDYQALVKIMDRARKLVLFDENEERVTPTFRMDKNGNLEQVAK